MRRVALGLGLMMESPSLDNSGNGAGASITKGRIQGEVRTSTGAAALGFVMFCFRYQEISRPGGRFQRGHFGGLWVWGCIASTRDSPSSCHSCHAKTNCKSVNRQTARSLGGRSDTTRTGAISMQVCQALYPKDSFTEDTGLAYLSKKAASLGEADLRESCLEAMDSCSCAIKTLAARVSPFASLCIPQGASLSTTSHCCSWDRELQYACVEWWKLVLTLWQKSSTFLGLKPVCLS